MRSFIAKNDSSSEEGSDCLRTWDWKVDLQIPVFCFCFSYLLLNFCSIYIISKIRFGTCVNTWIRNNNLTTGFLPYPLKLYTCYLGLSMGFWQISLYLLSLEYPYSPHGGFMRTAPFSWNVLLRYPHGLFLHDLVVYHHVTLTMRKLSHLHSPSQHFLSLPFPSFSPYHYNHRKYYTYNYVLA